MTKIYFTLLILFLLLIFGCVKEIKNDDSPKKTTEFALVVHGGAGYIYKGRYTKEEEDAYITKLTEALNYGYDILDNNGSAVDAVETAIRILEDSPLFNAGKGAVFTNEGEVELDASIMNGENINSGGIAGVKHIKNPITLARFVMEHSPHVLMMGEGAEKFADEFALKKVDNNYFKTESMIKKYKEKKNKDSSLLEKNSNNKFGTVGCVALDKNGNLAAGTSTGGMMGKKFGRVGDSPIIGAGTYANNNTCAISATGHGEFFIRNVVAHDISNLIEYKNLNIKDASDFVINNKLKKQDALGGIIGIDKFGNITMPFNTQGMFRGYRTKNNGPVVLLYE